MPGANRRNRRLQQTTDLTSIGEFSSVNPADGDILIFDFAAGAYENGRDLIGDYSISGTLTAADLLVTDDVTIQDALNVTGNTGLTGDLAVIGTSTLNGNATAAGTFGVTGAVTLSDALSVAGALTGSGFSFTSDGTITGTLGVTGDTTLITANITTLNVSGDSILTGFLSVDGITILNDQVTVNAAVSAGAVSATTLSSAGDLSMQGTLFWSTGNLSEDGDDTTIASTKGEGHLILTGLDTTLATVSLLDLDPDAHHIIGGVDGVIVPVGTTAQEPSGVDGMIRYDSTTTKFRAFENSAWVDMILAAPALDDITDVTLTTPATGAVLYKSAGDWLDTDALVIDPADSTQIKHAGTTAFETSDRGFFVYDATGVSTSPRIRWIDDKATGTVLANIGTSSGGFFIDNRVNTGLLTLRGSVSSGADTTLATFDPAGDSKLRSSGVIALSTEDRGAVVYDATGVSTSPRIRLVDTEAGGNLHAVITSSGTSLIIDNRQTNGVLTLRGSVSSGGDTLLFNADPAGITTLYFAGTGELFTKSGGIRIDDELEIDGALNHDGSTFGLYGTTPAAQSAAYTINATAVPDRTLLASASATTLNNNNVLAALIADLQLTGILG